VAGCCECDDEPSGSCATELVNFTEFIVFELTSIQVLSPLPIVCICVFVNLFLSTGDNAVSIRLRM
jgi:hypothetical protein